SPPMPRQPMPTSERPSSSSAMRRKCPSATAWFTSGPGTSERYWALRTLASAHHTEPPVVGFTGALGLISICHQTDPYEIGYIFPRPTEVPTEFAPWIKFLLLPDVQLTARLQNDRVPSHEWIAPFVADGTLRGLSAPAVLQEVVAQAALEGDKHVRGGVGVTIAAFVSMYGE